MKLADCCPVPPRTMEENLFRVAHFDMSIAKIGPDATTMRVVNDQALLLEYGQFTYPEKYNLGLTSDNPAPSVLALRIREYLFDNNLDGIFCDTPLENVPMPVLGVRLVNEIKIACAPKIVMPNMGDWIHWQGMGTNKEAWKALGVLCDWHFVEVACNLYKPFDMARWKQVCAFASQQLGLGKHVVLGIIAPNESAEDFALSLMLSFQHERLLWFFKKGDPNMGDHVRDYGWNPKADQWRDW